jgi:hypothetical protein
MVNPRAPRVFNLYDIIGVFFPGATLLFGVLLIFPTPPAPSAIWEYLFYLIVAFSLGHVTQAYASMAMGELKVFENTMDETRNVLEDDGDDDEGEGDEDDPDATDDQDGDDNAPDNDDEDLGLGERISSYRSGHLFLLYCLYPLIGPFIWWKWSPNDDGVEELLHANRVWKNLQQTYAFDIGTDRYEELQQMISSQVDDPRSPVRSYRFQAIRNFHRGMWVATWFIWLFVIVYEVGAAISPLGGWPYQNLFCFGGVETCSPFLIEAHSSLVISVVLLLVLAVFWRLTVYYERVFIRYLITDYFVILQNRDVDGGNGD